MSDVVERLRYFHEHGSILTEGGFKLVSDAADEIERLRAALQDIAEDPYAVDGEAAEIARRALEPKP